jgi:hypothetical protein
LSLTDVGESMFAGGTDRRLELHALAEFDWLGEPGRAGYGFSAQVEAKVVLGEQVSVGRLPWFAHDRCALGLELLDHVAHVATAARSQSLLLFDPLGAGGDLSPGAQGIDRRW